MTKTTQLASAIARSAQASTSRCIAPATKRAFSQAPRSMASAVTSLNFMTEEEEALRDAVRKFSTDTLTPEKVREMDEKEEMDPAIVKALFEAGVCSLCQLKTEDG